MALGKCPECGHDMSTDAEQCPNCGWKTTGKLLGDFGEAMTGCGVVLTIFVTIPILIIFGYLILGL